MCRYLSRGIWTTSRFGQTPMFLPQQSDTSELRYFPPRFSDPGREAAFLAHQMPASLSLVRIALAIGLAIYMAFGFVDPLVYDRHLASVYFTRFGIGGPAVFAALALTWTPLFRTWHQTILCMAVTVVGATIIAQILLEGAHDYYVGLILLMFFTYLFLRIRYLVASGICLGLILACAVLGPLLNPLDMAGYVTQISFLVGGLLVASLVACFYEIGVRREYIQRQRIEAQQAHLHALAYHDETTGLANRHLFRDRLAERVARASGNGESIAVGVVGLDRLREISELYGREGGDDALAAIARCLRTVAPSTATVARLESADFAIAVGPLAQGGAAAAAAEPLQRALAEPIEVAGDRISVRGSVGTSVYPEHGVSADRLIQAAMTAMDAARAVGPDQWLMYSTDMSIRVADNLQLEDELSAAVRRGEFLLHYQPQVRLPNGAVCGYEALLRWQHPQRGLLAPEAFLATLEHSGQLNTVSDAVIQEALAQYCQWHRAGVDVQPIAINLSPRQLLEGDLLERVEHCFATTRAPRAALRLEVTESAAMIDPDAAARVLAHFRDRGIESALDDFGKAYSSLNQLRHLPISVIKIDRAFMAGFPEDDDNRALVETIVTMAHQLGKRVLAEGVTTETQRRRLMAMGCDYAQGELFGMPVAAEELWGNRILACTSA